MDQHKSNSQEIEEELNEKTDNSDKSEALYSKHSKNSEDGDGDNKSKNSEKEDGDPNDKNEQIDNKSEHVEQSKLYEKTLENLNRSRRSSMVSNKPSRSNSPLVSKSVNFDLKKKRKNSTSNSTNQINKDFYLSSVNDMKYIGDQFKVGKIDSRVKSPFEERFQKRYEKTLKKMTANSKNFDSTKTLANYQQIRDPKKLIDPQFTLVNELKFAGQQFKLGKLDSRSKSPFEERFQKKFKDRLKVLLPNPNRMKMAFSFDELKQIHNTLSHKS
ncbi:hypothetical protein BpHYR1_012770 [Brachionus plicatilis]|uniref:Uncharacterized protein n=1 Tax=Brachionus plicatilis TaxID=10195 RepID=A0A3M7STG3_BRAPC|nr:hypothetical protein BpHYR1_012770 [Brachionus plicatilis]